MNINNLVLARWISTESVDALALLYAAHNARLRRPLTVRVIVPIPKGYPYHNATVFLAIKSTIAPPTLSVILYIIIADIFSSKASFFVL